MDIDFQPPGVPDERGASFFVSVKESNHTSGKIEYVCSKSALKVGAAVLKMSLPVTILLVNFIAHPGRKSDSTKRNMRDEYGGA
jgi:hypothetical protein